MAGDTPELPQAPDVTPPTNLKGAGLVEWHRLAGPLSEAGILTAVDLGAFVDLCRAVSELDRHERAARRLGVERAIASGVQGTVLRLRTQVSQLRARFGLVPSHRVKATRPKGQPTGKLAQFMKSSPLRAV